MSCIYMYVYMAYALVTTGDYGLVVFSIMICNISTSAVDETSPGKKDTSSCFMQKKNRKK